MEQELTYAERPLIHKSLPNLRSEISRLERRLLEMPTEGFQTQRSGGTEFDGRQKGNTGPKAGRGQTGPGHRSAATSLQSPSGGTNSCRGHYCCSCQSRTNPTTGHKRRTAGYAGGTENQDAPLRPMPDAKLQAPAFVPAQALSGLFQFLQIAGLDARQIASVRQILGSTMPPNPPAPPAAGSGSTHEPRTRPGAGTVPPAQAQAPLQRRQCELCLPGAAAHGQVPRPHGQTKPKPNGTFTQGVAMSRELVT